MEGSAKQIGDFICGMTPDANGRWYDEAAKTERGNFWWRKYVRQMQKLYGEHIEALQCGLLEASALMTEDHAMIAQLDGENAILEAENVELRDRLKACLDWMETGRASGDCGNWDWEEGDVYTLGRAALKET